MRKPGLAITLIFCRKCNVLSLLIPFAHSKISVSDTGCSLIGEIISSFWFDSKQKKTTIWSHSLDIIKELFIDLFRIVIPLWWTSWVIQRLCSPFFSSVRFFWEVDFINCLRIKLSLLRSRFKFPCALQSQKFFKCITKSGYVLARTRWTFVSWIRAASKCSFTFMFTIIIQWEFDIILQIFLHFRQTVTLKMYFVIVAIKFQFLDVSMLKQAKSFGADVLVVFVVLVVLSFSFNEVGNNVFFVSTRETHWADLGNSQVAIVTVFAWSICLLEDKCCHLSVKLSSHPFLMSVTTLWKVKKVKVQLKFCNYTT